MSEQVPEKLIWISRDDQGNNYWSPIVMQGGTPYVPESQLEAAVAERDERITELERELEQANTVADMLAVKAIDEAACTEEEKESK